MLGGGGSWGGTHGGGADVEGDLAEAGAAHGIQGLHHVGMAGFGVAADVDGSLRGLGPAGGEFFLQVGQADGLGVEMNVT